MSTAEAGPGLPCWKLGAGRTVNGQRCCKACPMASVQAGICFARMSRPPDFLAGRRVPKHP
jgi:hypothetical protein